MNDFEALILLNMIPSLDSLSIARLSKTFNKPKEIFGADR